jgi:hypothetical protein
VANQTGLQRPNELKTSNQGEVVPALDRGPVLEQDFPVILVKMVTFRLRAVQVVAKCPVTLVKMVTFRLRAVQVVAKCPVTRGHKVAVLDRVLLPVVLERVLLLAALERVRLLAVDQVFHPTVVPDFREMVSPKM